LQASFNNSNFEIGSGSNQGCNGGWRDGQQDFNNQGFNGEFGSFNEVYYDGGNGFNQGVVMGAMQIFVFVIHKGHSFMGIEITVDQAMVIEAWEETSGRLEAELIDQ
jgi:hypothetical protein